MSKKKEEDVTMASGTEQFVPLNRLTERAGKRSDPNGLSCRRPV
ncbi:hypothetical protein [Bradyrhizobium sp. SBR1B]|nr:hypothetical protein [Bradyrhizobium sp. SBR1B]MBB4383251.1 hypothetical protein [Bradyrhizobium sp. SBR1B]